MSNIVLETKGLKKKYGKSTVIDNFSFKVEKGHICGLIGPNGAGKTTIMKIMAGLTKSNGGSLELFGTGKDLDRNRRRISFLIENPMLDINMSAYKNMEYIKYLKGIPTSEKIDDVLEFVGLGDAKDKKVKKFSLGMRQRLAIGMAILSKPEILILDEPVNGLDPEGIVDVRKMIKRLVHEEEVTVLISSHILSELSELCTDYAIINHGCLVESITSEELQIKCENHITLKTDDINRTATILEGKLGISKYKVFRDEEVHIFEKLDDISVISRAITDSGLTILKLVEEGASLEEYYLSKVGGANV
ncbi:MAG: ABC transporter ATP-binding protein [Clostridiales bacterium]|nr:ABC transporter ATP-binding protein [Clostridiales bacterium]